MCLIAFAIGQNRHFPLVVAANRDEFFRRPTALMDWWQTGDGQRVLAGKDLQSGGTWLAIREDGRVAAVTNVREGSRESGHQTRGELPIAALAETRQTLQPRLDSNRNRYAGFNLVSLDTAESWYYSNRDAHPGRNLFRGSYGLSNHLLQTPWPKMLRLRSAFTRCVESAGNQSLHLHNQLLPLLKDSTPAPDSTLPDTGVGLDTERFLSSPFIVGEHYGTRATTLVSVAADGEVRVTEQSWSVGGQALEKREFRWQR
ncbi:hypothetical protein C7H09_06120 [Marinobacter fuscus]|uniref:NRDE family protein n=1 Tax=Marinobacter fuscus TaxID=2109942 RepID=A0A2T1KKG6_9GAMM|nr:NRDE family protein [Marinobacter fuscus]PSF10518.1 hypothetical protein C7H09_06120 [Marinobacter fuscus]